MVSSIAMAIQVPIDITVVKHGEVAVLKMSGTDNRINMLFCKKWNEALDKVESWPDVRALVSTGSGKFYSNGLDLDFLKACNKSALEEFWTNFTDLRSRLCCFPMVTVAAINGHCFAGGLMMALVHDYRVMHKGKGWLGLNEVHIGLRFMNSMKVLFKEKFTPRLNRDAAVFGNRFTAVQAFDVGLIDDIAEYGGAESRAMQLAMAKIKNNKFGREILKAMKMDMYPEIVNATEEHSGKAVKKIESKL